MKVLMILLAALCASALAQSDVVVPEHEVVVPRQVERPRAKYNPAYNIQLTDKVTVVFLLNDVEAKRYNYTNTVAPADTNHVLRLVGRLNIMEVSK